MSLKRSAEKKQLVSDCGDEILDSTIAPTLVKWLRLKVANNLLRMHREHEFQIFALSVYLEDTAERCPKRELNRKRFSVENGRIGSQRHTP